MALTPSSVTSVAIPKPRAVTICSSQPPLATIAGLPRAAASHRMPLGASLSCKMATAASCPSKLSNSSEVRRRSSSSTRRPAFRRSNQDRSPAASAFTSCDIFPARTTTISWRPVGASMRTYGFFRSPIPPRMPITRWLVNSDRSPDSASAVAAETLNGLGRRQNVYEPRRDRITPNPSVSKRNRMFGSRFTSQAARHFPRRRHAPDTHTRGPVVRNNRTDRSGLECLQVCASESNAIRYSSPSGTITRRAPTMRAKSIAFFKILRREPEVVNIDCGQRSPK